MEAEPNCCPHSGHDCILRRITLICSEEEGKKLVNRGSGLWFGRNSVYQMQKEELLKEIIALLNQYGTPSSINPSVLEFLSVEDLEGIKSSLIESKKHHLDDKEWLHQFKKED